MNAITDMYVQAMRNIGLLHITHTSPPSLETCDILRLWSILATFSDRFGILFSLFRFLKQSLNVNRVGGGSPLSEGDSKSIEAHGYMSYLRT